MTTKTQQEDCLQVVFLIDESAGKDFVENGNESASQSIPLCVLRILSFFNNHFESRVRWGYKFYDSSSLSHRYERHNFQEFFISEFEDFEKNVQSRLRDPSKIEEQQLQQISTRSSSTASKCLTCALTEVLHDFQWDSNDLNSPLKPTRRKTSTRTKQNVVFLISSCPKSLQSLEVFLGRSMEDGESFQSSVMSNALFKEFVDIYKIKLYWIDTKQNEKLISKENKIFDMIKAFLQSLHGRVIPLQALVNTSDHPFHPLNIRPSIPIMSVLSHYVRIHNNADARESIADFGLLDQCDSNKWTGFLCSQGSPPKIHCLLQLRSMFTPTTLATTTSYPDGAANLRIASGSDCVTRHTIQLSHNISETDNQSSESKNPNIFWIKGVLRRDKVCPTWFHLSKVYSCVAMVTASENDACSTGSALSGWFQRLMMALSKQNLLLVIEMQDPLSHIQVTGVIQPLTSLCGTINIIITDRLMAVEKLLQWNLCELVESESNKCLPDDLEIPVDKEKGSRNPTECEVHCSVINGKVDDNMIERSEDVSKCSNENGETLSNEKRYEPVKTFSMQDLNSWSLGLACLQPVQGIIKQNARRSNNGDITNESSLIKKLKELYSNKKESLKTTKTKTPKRLKPQHSTKGSSKKKKHKTTLTGKQNDTGNSKDMMNTKTDHMNADEPVKNQEKDRIKELLATLDLKDEADLKTFLKDCYSNSVAQAESPSEFIAKVMSVIQWYNGKQENTDSKASLQQLLSDTLLMDNLTIRDKYEGRQDSKETKLQEYQIQVLLRLEIVCSLGDPETFDYHLVDEVVVMLRSMSFIKDPGFLKDFLREIIIVRYVDSIPKFLCEIYEGLMINLPTELLSPSKHDEEEESPLKRCHVSVVRPESDQPTSERPRPLTRHRSIADIGGKRREIVIPAKLKSKKKHKTGTASLAHRSDHQKAKVQKTPVKKVRRNLFTEEEEEENEEKPREPQNKIKLKVPAVFGKDKKTNHQVPPVFAKDDKKHKQVKRRHSVAAHASKVVRETPCRKQLHNALWHKQHRARKRASTVTEDLNVVKESPLKEIIEGENLPRRSPRRHPGSVFQRSTSFYGENAKSCPLVRTKSFTSTIQAQSPVKKLDWEAEEATSAENKSDLDNSTGISNDVPNIVKESPIRFSPRKRSRFSLHTLLTSTEVSKAKNSKAVTPKKVVQASVRSSPRLLKKRSFSFIGFSNTSRLERSASIESADDSTSKALTPRKRVLLTPTRSSPRLKRKNDDLGHHTDDHPALLSSARTENDSFVLTNEDSRGRKTPRKEATLSHPTRSRANEEDSRIELQGSQTETLHDIGWTSSQLTIHTPRKKVHTPTRSSPRIQRKEQGELLTTPIKTDPLESNDEVKVSTPARVSTSKALSTPTRSSPRLKQKIGKLIAGLDSPVRLQTSPTFKKETVTPLVLVNLPEDDEYNNLEVSDAAGLHTLPGGLKLDKTLPSDLVEPCSNLDSSYECPSSKKQKRFNLSLSKRKKQRTENSRQESEYDTGEIRGKQCEEEYSSERDLADTVRTQCSEKTKRGAKRSLDSLRDELEGENENSLMDVNDGEESTATSLSLRTNQKKSRAKRSLDSLCNDREETSKINEGNNTVSRRSLRSQRSCAKRSLDSLRNKTDDKVEKDSRLGNSCQENIGSSSHRTLRSPLASESANCDFSRLSKADESQELSTSRKRLSFSPNTKSKRPPAKTRPSFDQQHKERRVLGSEDRECDMDDEAIFNDSLRPNKTTVISDTVDESTLFEPLKSNTFKSNKASKMVEGKQHFSHVVDGQRLLTSKPAVSTPPRKRRKTRTNQETKRSSPLNQILKQKKRNRPKTFKSPRPKNKLVDHCHDFGEDVIAFGQSKIPIDRRIPIDLDECSKSSEDMMIDWFSAIQENDSSQSSLSESNIISNVGDTNAFGRDDEDNVFEATSTSFTRHSRPNHYKPSTPISVKSLKMLKESPILVQTDGSPVSSGSLTKRNDDPSPDEVCAKLRERLKRRKRADTLRKRSPTDDGDSESIYFRNSKRVKVGST